MSKRSGERFDFAYTQFLVESMRKIREYADTGNYRQALNGIYWDLMPFLDVDIQEKLEQEEGTIEAIAGKAGGVDNADPYMRIKEANRLETLESRLALRPILKKTMKLLHEAGYFAEARRGLFFDPSGGRKSGATPRRGFSQRVEAKT